VSNGSKRVDCDLSQYSWAALLPSFQGNNTAVGLLYSFTVLSGEITLQSGCFTPLQAFPREITLQSDCFTPLQAFPGK
jgi:hypothetical protein